MLLFGCLFYNERERKGVYLGGWGSGEDVGGVGGGEIIINKLYESIYFQKKRKKKKYFAVMILISIKCPLATAAHSLGVV